jgi:hypothetical protein
MLVRSAVIIHSTWNLDGSGTPTHTEGLIATKTIRLMQEGL